MRIVLTTHLFLPESSGGTETLVLGIAANLMQKGHIVLVVTGSDDKTSAGPSDGFDEFDLDSIRVMRFRRHLAPPGSPSNPMRDDYDNRDYENGFRRMIEEFKPDAVHFHHFGRTSIKAIDACRQQNIPMFLTVTDFWHICPQQALLLPNGKICDGPIAGGANCLKHMVELTQSKRLAGIVNKVPNEALGLLMGTLKRVEFEPPGALGLTQALAKRRMAIAQRFPSLNKIFVPTRHAKTTLERNGISAGNFRILPFGLKDHGYVKRARTRDGNALVLGFIGQFLPHKGLHVFIEALRSLPKDCPVAIKVYAKIPAKEAQYVRDFFAYAKADVRVTYEGTFENERIPAVLDGIDALVIPSIWHENMPLVSLSAQAAGCPVIASNVGGMSDIISHGVNGLLFEPGSAPELRDCILQLVSDQTMLYRLSQAAISPGSLSQYVDDLEREYRQAVGEIR